MKYYAQYVAPGDYEIITEKERDEILKNLTEDDSHMRDRYTFMNSYSSLTQAKNYLFMHLLGDISEARQAVKEIRAMRKPKL